MFLVAKRHSKMVDDDVITCQWEKPRFSGMFSWDCVKSIWFFHQGFYFILFFHTEKKCKIISKIFGLFLVFLNFRSIVPGGLQLKKEISLT